MSYITVSLRQTVEKRARYRCTYCQSQMRIVGASLTVDHIIPESLGGATTIENLCLACWDCNLLKSNRITAIDPRSGTVVRIFHPNRQTWAEHFRWGADSLRVVGLTAVGRATIVALRLNRPQLLLARTLWVEAGWHPPSD
ncbi:MAG: HNH endonuclease [Caldilineaceae bacterium]|nr:HNH endonuclease [Caldilineaceae bacterium]